MRRITRAIDLHSRVLASTYGLTGPQLVCLRAVDELGPTTPSALARHISLSQGTVTGIVDRLAARQLVTRDRDTTDRRRVEVRLTDAGSALVRTAPSPLQERFVEQLHALPAEDQGRIRDTLAQVVQMMGEGIEAAPVLSTSPAAQSVAEVRDVLATGVTDLSVVADVAPDVLGGEEAEPE